MVTRETVLKVAELSKLRLDESKIDAFTEQFSQLLSYIGEIDTMNLDGVEPLVHITESTNVFREDVPHTSLSRDEALSNAPKRNEGFFKVPKVLG
ncbi:MAG: Glutamyl-tRNA(Gln) amidotransferase subunit [Bacteroidota bacterium]|jgi:aspartyl-tRNA(Asn)/glutamyl-tRNA(Gln) amidotransferase subunit C